MRTRRRQKLKVFQKVTTDKGAGYKDAHRRLTQKKDETLLIRNFPKKKI